MSILYKILLFLWFFYLVSMFVYALGIFPYTPFSDIQTTDPTLYGKLTDKQNMNGTGILDYFFHYEADIPLIGHRTITGLGMLTLFLVVGTLISVVASDIRPLVVAFTFGAIVSMLMSSMTFITKIFLATNGGGSPAAIILVGIIAAAILFILGITAAEKIIGGGGVDD